MFTKMGKNKKRLQNNYIDTEDSNFATNILVIYLE